MADTSRKLLFAITSHGLGHLIRSVEIVRELVRGHRGVHALISTAISPDWISSNLDVPFEYRRREYEPGVIQKNCFEVDEEATRKAYRTLFGDRERRVEEEREFMRASGVSAVISDIPALPIRAAADLGLPAYGVSNFTWDWILEPYFEDPAQAMIPAWLAEDYGRGDRHLRLPLGPSFSPFPRSEPAGLVARRTNRSSAEVRARLGLPQNDPLSLVVVCPGGWDATDWGAIHVPGCESYRFVTVGDLPVTTEAPSLHFPHALPGGLRLVDLVATADLVLAKPGYGIGSECVVHRTPLLAIERPGFRETPVLLEELHRLGPVGTIALDAFFAGAWELPLGELDREVNRAPGAWSPLQGSGAEKVALRIGDLLGLEPADRS